MAYHQRLCYGLLRAITASSPPLLRPTRATFSTTPFQKTIVKVPEMAESISEGTLSSFSKQVGDQVERDEEIASIETDKVRRPNEGFWHGLLTQSSRLTFL